jgi:hypothetical protein
MELPDSLSPMTTEEYSRIGETALYTLQSSFNSFRITSDPIQTSLFKNLSSIMFKYLGSKVVEQFMQEVGEIYKIPELKNGEIRRYNDLVLQVLNTAIDQIEGKNSTKNPPITFELPRLSKHEQGNGKTKILNQFLVSVYLDLAGTVYKSRLDDMQSQKLDQYTTELSKYKTFA